MKKTDLRKLGVPFDDVLAESLKNAEFKKLWEASEADYQIARQMIKARLEKKMSQRVLAKRAKTTQARISELEGQNANPSLATLKRISAALGIKFQLSI